MWNDREPPRWAESVARIAGAALAASLVLFIALGVLLLVAVLR
jgi:hypothetical protein